MHLPCLMLQRQHKYVVIATLRWRAMSGALDAIFHRRAVKVFEPVEISDEVREQILNAARHAPSSFNSQPYKFYWVGSAEKKAAVAKLCWDRSPRKRRLRWWWLWRTSDRCRPRRKGSWSGCAGATSPKKKFATTSAMLRLGGSCSCRGHSEYLPPSSGSCSGCRICGW